MKTWWSHSKIKIRKQWAVPVRSYAIETLRWLHACQRCLLKLETPLILNERVSSCATMETTTPLLTAQRCRSSEDTRNIWKKKINQWYFQHVNIKQLYRSPSTTPSFLPVASSSITPHQLPVANLVSPMYFRIPGRLPRPDETMTRSPTAKLLSEDEHDISLTLFNTLITLTRCSLTGIAEHAMRRRNGTRAARRQHWSVTHVHIAVRWDHGLSR